MCSPATFAAAEHTLGATVGYNPEDIVHAKLVVLWGTNNLTSRLTKNRAAHVTSANG